MKLDATMDQVRRTTSVDHPRHSVHTVAFIYFIACFSVVSISISQGLISKYKDVFTYVGVDHFGRTVHVSMDIDDQVGSIDSDMDASAGEENNDIHTAVYPKIEGQFEYKHNNDTRTSNVDKSAGTLTRTSEKIMEGRTDESGNDIDDHKVNLIVAGGGNESVAKTDVDTNRAGDDEDIHTEPKSNKSSDEHSSTQFNTTSSTANEDRDSEQQEQQQQQQQQRMNVLILYPDDWRWNTIGRENSIIQTPFLDSLMDDGIHFRQNAVTTSICWQSRATLFSGQWTSRHQSYKLKCPHFAKNHRWNETWPAQLQSDGYFVGHVGKWQYYNDNEDKKRMFDWQRCYEGKHWYGMTSAEDRAKNDAIHFLRDVRPKDKPFALTVAFYPPKPVGDSRDPGGQWTPKNNTRAIYDNITIPEPYNMTHARTLLPLFLQPGYSKSKSKSKSLSTIKAANYRFYCRYRTPEHYQEAMKNMYALVTQVDDACRQIVDEVKEQGLYNNTMIIFTTDNGMFHGSHGLAGKWYPYQESIRVPLIIHDPRMPRHKVGTVDDEHLTLNVDLASTILGAAGLDPHERMQGRDISDLYLANTNISSSTSKNTSIASEHKPWRDEFFYEFDIFSENEIPSSNALVRKKWKYIYWPHHKVEELFNLEDDPMEFTSVIDDPENAGIVEEMRKRMFELKDGLEEPEDERLEC